MSLLDDVSIVVTPNGYKAGELYAVIPSNGDADMDVTRATAATRVDEDGLVNYAEIVSDTELVTNGDFATDSDWTKGTGWTISEGNLNASNVNAVSTTQSGYTFVGKTFQVSYTISDYSQGSVQIYLGGSQSTSLKSVNGTHTETISISSGNTTLYVYGASNFTGNINNVSVKEVTRDNVPRIDYTGGGCPHILAEPQRTNLVTYSEDYSSGTFFSITQGSTIDNTTSTSPSGDDNATQLTSTGDGKLQTAGFSLTQNTDYTFSFYAKNVDATAVTSRVLGIGGSGGSNLTSVSYFSELSTTEWTRITHKFNTGTNTTFYLYLSNALNSGGTIQLWGAQLEEGSYATSYIPTSGSTVTRNQDIFSRDGIGSLINSTEGVLFLEVSALVEVDTARRFITLNDGGASNNVVLRYEATGVITARYQVGGVAQCSIAFATTITNSHKIAFKYKVNDFALWIDGTEVGIDTSGSVLGADTINKISFDHGGGSFPFYGKVKQLQVYTTALTDTQLAALTS